MSQSPVSESVVRVRDLTVSYRTRQRIVPALRGLSLSVAAGESYGLVGESGSSKSTAAMALTRYLPPGTEVTAAQVSVAGTGVLGLDAAALRSLSRKVYRLHRTSRAAAGKATLTGIERVRLSDPQAIARRYLHELSGGQQQRIVIAMALAGQPT